MPELALQTPKGIQTRGSLLDLLDRVIGKGVVAYGDIVLSIADLDLVYLNLRAVLSSIGTLESTGHSTGEHGAFHCPGRRAASKGSRPAPADVPRARACGPEKLEEMQKKDVTAAHPIAGGAPGLWKEWKQILKGTEGWKQIDEDSESSTNIPCSASTYTQPPFFTEASIKPEGSKPGKLKLDPQKTAQGLAKLAMTLINLLRKLMERQAIRRMEGGTLTPEQLERAGQAFQRLDDQIKDLCNQFGLKEEDLNLDLGPLGKLV